MSSGKMETAGLEPAYLNYFISHPIKNVTFLIVHISITALWRLALVFIVPCMTLSGVRFYVFLLTGRTVTALYLCKVVFNRYTRTLITAQCLSANHKESSFRLPFRELVSAQVLYDFGNQIRMVRPPILSRPA